MKKPSGMNIAMLKKKELCVRSSPSPAQTLPSVRSPLRQLSPRKARVVQLGVCDAICATDRGERQRKNRDRNSANRGPLSRTVLRDALVRLLGAQAHRHGETR